MRKAIIIIGALFALSGCSDVLPKPSPEWQPNQAKRQEFFLACMNALPAGPQKTQYNDWDEVVEACQSASYYQSLYCVANCPPPPLASLPSTPVEGGSND